MKRLYAPTGALIIGTLERIPGCANAHIWVDDEGDINVDYTGYTTVWWDGQTTETIEKKTIYVCEEGGEWPESECVVREGPDVEYEL